MTPAPDEIVDELKLVTRLLGEEKSKNLSLRARISLLEQYLEARGFFQYPRPSRPQ